MKKLFVITAFILFTFSVSAQTADDALRYSQNFYESTARSTAMGGAFGALGADLSTSATNPAGMGLFRTSYYSISPAINIRDISSDYNATLSSDNKTTFNLNNFGYVKAIQLGPENGKGWKFMQFSFGMNRLNNFNSNLDMQGANSKNSRLDVYLENADGVNYEDIANDKNKAYSFDLNPAWQLYLIDTIPGYPDWYYSSVPFGGTYQRERLQTRGAINEWYFSFSANYNNFLFLGATIGIDALRYSSTSYYSEYDAADTIPYFKSWKFNQNLETRGSGINIKIGLIVQPVKWLRVGVAYHSPTWYFNMRDTWYTTTFANLEWTSPASVSSPTGTYQYSLSTPMKFLADAGLIIANRGSISFEYEYLNYANARFKSSNYNYLTENGNIQKYFHSTNNFRMGTEWRFGATDVRAGYAVYGSPYARKLNDGMRQSISGGLGFHINNSLTIDVAYVYTKMNKDYYFYGTKDIVVNPAKNTFHYQSVVLSFGYRL